MLTQRLANITFAVLVIGLCIWFGWMAQGFETSGLLASSGLPSKFFPQLTLGFMAICAAIVAFQYMSQGEGEGFVFESGGHMVRGLLTLVVAIACYLIWRNFGFIPMAFAIGPLSCLAMGVRSLKIYATVLVLTAIVYAVFTYLLRVQLV